MKKALLIIILLLICVSLASCKQNKSTTDSTLNSDEVSVLSTQSESQTIENTQPERRLSEECDEILASGTNKNGDLYELVCSKEENFETSVVKFGVIKNNQWVLELDNDIFEYVASSHGSYSYMNMYYVGNGCFMQGISKVYGTGVTTWRYIVYNSDTKQRFSTENFSNQIPIPIYKNDNRMILQYTPYSNYTHFVVLNTDNMTTNEFSIEGSLSDFSNISEGLFAVAIGTGRPVISFYSADGIAEQSIKARKTGLSENDDESRGFDVAFNNGRCTYDVYNEANTMYTITIDRQGNVIDSYKKY